MKKAIDPYMNSEVDWKENRYAETEHHIFAKSLG
jgi:hypothetical protein